MEEEELSVVDEILQNYTVSVIKDTKSIREIKILNNNQALEMHEDEAYANIFGFRRWRIIYGTEFNFDKKIKIHIQTLTGGGGSGVGAEDTTEMNQHKRLCNSFGMGKTIIIMM